MKMRRLVLTIEMETDSPLRKLKEDVAAFLEETPLFWVKVFQVQANVIRPDPRMPLPKSKYA